MWNAVGERGCLEVSEAGHAPPMSPSLALMVEGPCSMLACLAVTGDLGVLQPDGSDSFKRPRWPSEC